MTYFSKKQPTIDLTKEAPILLDFSKSAISYIVEEALSKKVGARGLKGVIEKKMYDIMFELPTRRSKRIYGHEGIINLLKDKDPLNQILN